MSGMNLHVVANNLFILVGRDSGGVYTCRVNNSAGTVSDDFFVTINGKCVCVCVTVCVCRCDQFNVLYTLIKPSVK